MSMILGRHFSSNNNNAQQSQIKLAFIFPPKKKPHTEIVKVPFKFNRFLLTAFDKKVLEIVQSTKGCWLAGGSALAMYVNKPEHITDWDIYYKDTAVCDILEKAFQQEGFVFKGENRPVKNYAKDSVKVQVINSNSRELEQNFFMNFDLTICCIAVCENDFVMTKEAQRDINNKEINMVYINNEPNSKIRVEKYEKRGFKVSSNFWTEFKDFCKTHQEQLAKRASGSYP